MQVCDLHQEARINQRRSTVSSQAVAQGSGVSTSRQIQEVRLLEEIRPTDYSRDYIPIHKHKASDNPLYQACRSHVLKIKRVNREQVMAIIALRGAK